MKKLGFLIALAMLVSIGGVYAVWTYTGATISAVDRTLSHGLAAATNAGDIGVLEVVSNNVDVKIDQTAPGNYAAKLVITGAVQVKFTPNAGAPDGAVNSLDALVYLTNADTYKYNGSQIYNLKNGGAIDLSWTPSGDDYTATISADQIDAVLDLGSFTLDTYAKYLDFHSFEEHITITLSVQQGVTP